MRVSLSGLPYRVGGIEVGTDALGQLRQRRV